MQNQRRVRNSGALKGNLDRSNGRKCSPYLEHTDSSEKYEEAHISYQFRRWANHIWSVSNNVKSRLQGLISTNPCSNTTSNHSVGENNQDESNATSWSASTDAIESPNPIMDADCNTRRYLQTPQNHCRSNPRENYCSRCDQRFGHMKEDHRRHRATANRVQTTPHFIMGHGVTNYPPVLILPRIGQGVNRHTHAGFYQSRLQTLRYRKMQGDECREGWYLDSNRFGRQWGSEGSRSRNHHPSIPDRYEIPEKLSSLMNDPKTQTRERKSTRSCCRERRIEPGDEDFKSVKHFSTHVRDFRSESYSNGHESMSPVRDTRGSREESFSRSCIPRNYGDNNLCQRPNHTLKSCAHSKAKKVGWDLQLSDITSQESNSTNPSRDALSVKSSVTLLIENKKAFVSQNGESNLGHYEHAEEPVKDDSKKSEFAVPPTSEINTDKNLVLISHDTPEPRCTYVTERKDSEKQKDDSVNSNSIKWSSVTENSVDSLLQSLRERMDTLSNVHSLDTEVASGSIERSRKKETNLTKECIVASCLAGTYPQCLGNRRNQMAVHSVTNNEEIRPSFSDRIQDIWRDGRARVWRSSPRHDASSGYNLKPEKNLSSKLSLLGLNQQPVLREYFAEYNNTVTLARILEKLIDSKSKSEVPATPVSENLRISRKESKTCLQVNVGVQKSTTTSTTSSKDSRSTYRSIEKHKGRGSLKRNIKPRTSQLPIETPRPLQVFSGESIIPISSIQFTPINQPLGNFPGFARPPMDVGLMSNCYDDPSDRHEHSVIVDNPVFRETNPVSVVDTGFKPSSATSNRFSPSFARSPYGMKNGRLISRDKESSDEVETNRQLIDEQERILSILLEKIEHERQRAARKIALNHQRELQRATLARLEESRVIKDQADAASEGMSPKNRSWWTRTFRFNKSHTLKGKMTSFLKYVTKKHTDRDYSSHNYAFNEAFTDIVVPTPPVRRRRKYSKSIQWDLVSRCIEKIDSSQVTENQQSNKSTSVSPIITKVTVTSGTNTNQRKPHTISAKLSHKQNKEASKHDFNDSSNKSPTAEQRLMEADVVADAKEKSESSAIKTKPSLNDFMLHDEEDLTNPCRKGENKSEKLKVSSSLSSKIPLATCNVSSTVSRKRPCTVPILGRLPSNSIKSNALFGESEAGNQKSFSRELATQECAKKIVFKHNRSSLLRANNSMTKKYSTGQCNIWRRIVGEKDTGRKLVSTAATNPLTNEEVETLPKLSSIEEIRCEKVIPEKHLETDRSGTVEKILLLADAEVRDVSKPLSTSANSEHGIKQTVTGKTSSSLLAGISLLKTRDSTLNTDISNPHVSLLKSWSGDLEHSSNKEDRNLSRDGKSIRGQLEISNDKLQSSKTSIPPLHVQPHSSSCVTKEKKTAMVNLESEELGDHEDMSGSSALKRKTKGSCEDCSTLPDGEDNAKFEEAGKLPTRAEVSEDLNPESNDLKESEGSSNRIRLRNLNVSKLPSDTKPISTENCRVQESPEEGLSPCRVEADEVQSSLNGKTKFGPHISSSIVHKTGKHLLEHLEVSVPKVVLRGRDMCTLERPRRPSSQSKFIANSKFLPPHTVSKTSKKITSPSTTGAKYRSANDEALGAVDDSQSALIEKPESQKPELVSDHKTVKTVSRVAGGKQNTKLPRLRKTRNKNTEEILEVVREVIESVVISESENIDRRTNSGVVNGKHNICRRIFSNSEKSSELSIDSLEPIRSRTIPETTSSIRKGVLAPTDEFDETDSSSLSLVKKKEFGDPYAQKQANIWLKKAQLNFSPTSEREIMSDAIINEIQNHYPRIQLSKKFLTKSKPFFTNETSGICAVLNTKSGENAKDECQFTKQRSKISCGRFVDKIHRDDKLEVATMPGEMVTDLQNCKDVMPVRVLEMKHYLTQSIITFDLAEMPDKPERLRPSMFNLHLESTVKLAESKLEGSVSKEGLENGHSSDADNNSRVMNDGNSGKSSKADRNVKIDNKVLEEKVKCSMENGVPLKTITIMDPSIIKRNCLSTSCTIADKDTRNQVLRQMGSEVQEKLCKQVYNKFEDLCLKTALLADGESEGQYSHTTWASHENRVINIDNKIVPKIPLKSGYAELRTVKELTQIIGKATCAVDQNDSAPNTTSLRLKKNWRRSRGTLIPRYKTINVVPGNDKTTKTTDPIVNILAKNKV